MAPELGGAARSSSASRRSTVVGPTVRAPLLCQPGQKSWPLARCLPCFQPVKSGVPIGLWTAAASPTRSLMTISKASMGPGKRPRPGWGIGASVPLPCRRPWPRNLASKSPPPMAIGAPCGTRAKAPWGPSLGWTGQHLWPEAGVGAAVVQGLARLATNQAGAWERLDQASGEPFYGPLLAG